MNFIEMFDEALKNTKILRMRLKSLEQKKSTVCPYTIIMPSRVDSNDALVKKGNVIIEKPIIILPENLAEFIGFEFEKMGIRNDILNTVLLMRGIRLPSMRYKNLQYKIDVVNKNYLQYANEIAEKLKLREDTEEGVITTKTPDSWQFSLLIYTASLFIKNLPNDIKNIL
ncbi:MAG: hypothetical protein NZ870_04155 [bacterium]|nr:hypothetical protein [bacterium]